MDHDSLEDLGKPVDIPEPEPLTGAEARTVYAYIMERDLLEVSAAEILLKALFSGRTPCFSGGDSRIGRDRQAADQEAGAVGMGRQQVFDLGPLLDGDHIPGGKHVDLVEFKLPCSAPSHQSAGIDEDKVGSECMRERDQFL